MQYFIVRNGQQAGPFELNQLLAEGVTPTTLVWCEGMTAWTPAQNVPEVAGIFQQQNYAQPPVIQPVVGTPYATQQPTYATRGQQLPPKPSTHLALAIISLVLCCWPLGIVAVIQAAGVSSAYARGDYNTAVSKSHSAKTWSIVAMILGCILAIGYIIFYIFYFDALAGNAPF